jgi:hypothetical protein
LKRIERRKSPIQPIRCHQWQRSAPSGRHSRGQATLKPLRKSRPPVVGGCRREAAGSSPREESSEEISNQAGDIEPSDLDQSVRPMPAPNQVDAPRNEAPLISSLNNAASSQTSKRPATNGATNMKALKASASHQSSAGVIIRISAQSASPESPNHQHLRRE